MMNKVVKIDPEKPDPALVERTARVLSMGGMIIFPTETFYGLGVDATRPDAIARIYKVKGRPFNKPLPVLISSIDQLAQLVEEIPKSAGVLIDRFWPDGLTLVFRAAPVVPSILTAGTGKIGIRFCSEPIVNGIIDRLGHPITATSANISGHDSVSDPQLVNEVLVREADLVLDGGITSGGAPSTVVDVTTTPVSIIRRGVVSEKSIKDCLASQPTNIL